MGINVNSIDFKNINSYKFGQGGVNSSRYGFAPIDFAGQAGAQESTKVDIWKLAGEYAKEKVNTTNEAETSSLNTNALSEKDNIFASTNPIIEGNNGLTSTQRVNPTKSTNPLSPDDNTKSSIASINYLSPSDEGAKTKELGQKFLSWA